MLSKEEIESMKIGLWNIRADTLKTMQCSLADTSDKKEWQKEINVIDNALEYIDNLESDKQKLIEKLEEKIKELEEKLKKQHGRVNEVTCFTEGELYQLKEILSMIKEREVK